MKVEKLYFARLPDPIRPGRFYRTRHKMLRADIERRGGEVLEGTLELREIAETDVDFMRRAPTMSCRAAPDAIGVTRPTVEPPTIRVTPAIDEDAIQLARRLDAFLVARSWLTGEEAVRRALVPRRVGSVDVTVSASRPRRRS